MLSVTSISPAFSSPDADYNNSCKGVVKVVVITIV